VREENKGENIWEETDRADESMRAADLLFDNGFTRDAVAKLYYSLLYMIRAILLTKGLEPKSHEGALRLFGLHFVKQGVFEAKDSYGSSLKCMGNPAWNMIDIRHQKMKEVKTDYYERHEFISVGIGFDTAMVCGVV
jgi:uncharacterized protein (UPF0332 family)